MPDSNIHNIPAYKRKRSISAQARKTNLIKKTPKKPRKVTRKRLEPIDPENELAIPNTDSLEKTFIEPTKSSLAEPTTIKEMKTCGSCEGYFEKLNVTILKLTSPLRIGDIILIEKINGLFQQEITSMQIDNKQKRIAFTGSEIGIKTSMKPKIGGTIYKVI